MKTGKKKWTSSRSPSRGLSAADWTSLCSIIQLPDTARADIDRCFAHYRRIKGFKDEELTNSELKKSLLRIAKIAEAYVAEIQQLGPSEYFWLDRCRGHYLYATTEDEFSDAIWALANDAQTVAQWFVYAAGRAKERKSFLLETDWVEGLIDALDRVLEKHAGLRARRGTKAPAQFIRAACKIADPTLGPGTIEEAFKLVAKRNRNLVKSSLRKTSKSATQF